ncbi:MAG TPA: T9SS type A sorting domain-containing protein, partial [Mariniflexile sp.]|nr:T9SS type A sorting domain-containing protein [Mariniflexile sp.]
GAGSLKIRQQGTTNVYNYNYWSAPVNRSGNWQIGYLENATKTVNFTSALNGSVSPTTITLSTRWLYGFKGAQNNYNAWAALTPTSNIAPGVGYTLKGSGAATPDQEFIFRGRPNDGTYTFPVAANTEFLVGNPYPSALNANKFITDNLSVIDGSLYFWESFSSNNSHYLAAYEGGYAIYNLMMPMPAIADASNLTSGNGTTSRPIPTQYVPVGQGFFTTITNPGTLRFDNSQRAFARESLNQTVYYKTASKGKNAENEDNRPKIWFSFTQPKGYTKFLGLGYDTNTTYGYDKGYDAKLYDSFKNDIFWLMDEEPLVIQALPEINTNDQLPLGITIDEAGIYQFAISNMENVPDDLPIYLHDNDTNTYYNLRNGDAQLVLNKQANGNQFSIVFKEQGTLATTQSNLHNLGASYNPSTKTLKVLATQPVNTMDAFHIYNTMGQLVLTVNAPKTTSVNLSNIANGVYILKIDSKAIKNVKSIKFVKY